MRKSPKAKGKATKYVDNVPSKKRCSRYEDMRYSRLMEVSHEEVAAKVNKNWIQMLFHILNTMDK
ncbi:hypothetical protein MKW98_006732 [Papaver atlanticum]|uniref:Uncharacterized protein n=1 Tax=Papaver atlanticum TaxID=357466 RepID=A0AAD4XQ96_9MAGN|nr:hypothetical protein MKW98_006732 [Papaver atlanticum]